MNTDASSMYSEPEYAIISAPYYRQDEVEKILYYRRETGTWPFSLSDLKRWSRQYARDYVWHEHFAYTL